MRFLHLGRDVGIGANSYLLEEGSCRVILDAGMHPKKQGVESTPDFGLLADGPEPEAIFLSHAHQDHVGTLPVLTRLFPRTPVYMTQATARIADAMLHNSVNVMGRQREESGVADAVLYSHRAVELSKEGWRLCPLEKWQALEGRGGERSGCGFSFHHAGHILGSAGVLLELHGRRVFYTGDVHFGGQTLMPAARFPEGRVEVLIMETTRGDSPQPVEWSRESEKQRLAAYLLEAFAEDASVLIPVFALGKTQELLAMLWELKRASTLPHTPLYIGGLSTKITSIYDAYCNDELRLHPGLALLQEVGPYVVSGAEIDALKPRKRCIYALSSGMLTENTLSNLFARRILEDPRQRIAFVGYTDPESPAGRLRAAGQDEEVVLHPELPPLRKRCRVEAFQFSAHAPREDLLEYAVRLNPRVILLVHGDPPALEWFATQLSARLPGARVVIPCPGEPVEV